MKHKANLARTLYYFRCLHSFRPWSQQSTPTKVPNRKRRTAELGRLPIDWIIGPHSRPGTASPLKKTTRSQIFVWQTFLTAGSYVASVAGLYTTRFLARLLRGHTREVIGIFPTQQQLIRNFIHLTIPAASSPLNPSPLEPHQCNGMASSRSRLQDLHG